MYLGYCAPHLSLIFKLNNFLSLAFDVKDIWNIFLENYRFCWKSENDTYSRKWRGLFALCYVRKSICDALLTYSHVMMIVLQHVLISSYGNTIFELKPGARLMWFMLVLSDTPQSKNLNTSCANFTQFKNVFKILLNIYDGGFLQQLSTAFSRWLFVQKISFTVVWEGPKYASALAKYRISGLSL